MSSPAPADSRPSRSAGPETDEPRLTFRGESYDAAVAAAESALGARPRVLAANRVRRGGIGGFFATDLGVEIEVTVAGETLDETLERLVDAGASSDRELWVRELAAAVGLAPADIEPDPEPAAVAELAVPAEIALVPEIAPAPVEAILELVADLDEPAVPAPMAGPPPAAPADRRPASTAAPTRRHVDLAVGAATELMCQATRSKGAAVTIRVTVTGADGRSVAIDANVEPPMLLAEAS